PEGISGPIKNKPVQLANGELLCPSSAEYEGWKVHFERTSDFGATWTRTPDLNDPRVIRAIQPSILFHPGGRLQAVGRAKNRRVFEIWSEDQGKTWGEMTLLNLPNPGSAIDAVTLADGRQLMVYNHSSSERNPLNISVSKDGKVWDAAVILEDD